jgi:hypothetical protein
MGRLWIGVGILVVMLAMAIGLLWGSRAFFEDFSDNLEQAGASALAGNWASATQKAEKSRAQWEKYRHFWSAFTDHEPMEQMQELFSRLEIYRQKQLEVDFAAVCGSLVQMAEAIDESHSLKWWSVL